MKPTLGWTLLSRDALKRAEESVLNKTPGVRDEIGFLLIHQAFADHFFPGTSVLQTRLRYILFVPWMYQRIAQTGTEPSVTKAIELHELSLIERLNSYYQQATGSVREGIIGIVSYGRGKLTSQLSSMVYWTALGRWGILKPLENGLPPSRATFHQTISRQTKEAVAHDVDDQPLEEQRPLFVGLPKPPEDWAKVRSPISFELTESEQVFLQKQLGAVRRPNDGNLSLLARLADSDFDPAGVEHSWHPSVLECADTTDREKLLQAEAAAALSAIGRGVYAALVEHCCETFDKRHDVGHLHRDHLQKTINTFRAPARKLDVDALQTEFPKLQKDIVTILRETQDWVNKSRRVTDLLDLYSDVEFRRKRQRSRLFDRQFSQNRRMEWAPDHHTPAVPLHYRWDRVKQLLVDLRDAHE